MALPPEDVKSNGVPAESLIQWGGDPDGTRTRVAAVKGRSLNRLTTGPCLLFLADGGIAPPPAVIEW